jgi:hypothetical protein
LCADWLCSKNSLGLRLLFVLCFVGESMPFQFEEKSISIFYEMLRWASISKKGLFLMSTLVTSHFSRQIPIKSNVNHHTARFTSSPEMFAKILTVDAAD